MFVILLSSEINDDDKDSDEETNDEPFSDSSQDLIRNLKCVIDLKDSNADHQ